MGFGDGGVSLFPGESCALVSCVALLPIGGFLSVACRQIVKASFAFLSLLPVVVDAVCVFAADVAPVAVLSARWALYGAASLAFVSCSGLCLHCVLQT